MVTAGVDAGRRSRRRRATRKKLARRRRAGRPRRRRRVWLVVADPARPRRRRSSATRWRSTTSASSSRSSSSASPARSSSRRSTTSSASARDQGEFFALMLHRHVGHDAARGRARPRRDLRRAGADEHHAVHPRRASCATTRAARPALKYLLLGAVSSAVILYGMAFLFGISGTTRLVTHRRRAEHRRARSRRATAGSARR